MTENTHLPVRVALVERGTVLEIHLCAAADAPVLRTYLHVNYNDDGMAVSEWFPEEIPAGTHAIARSGQGPRCVLTLINDGEDTLRDLSVELWEGETDVTGLLIGTCPQRLAAGGRVSLTLEQRGPERAYQLTVRHVNLRGVDVCASQWVCVGIPKSK